MKHAVRFAIIMLALVLAGAGARGYAQERVNRARGRVEPRGYAFTSAPVEKVMFWYREEATGQWVGDADEGYWDLVCFKSEGKDVYALRFRVNEDRRYIGLAKNYVYYFITHHDVLRIRNMVLDEPIAIMPYGNLRKDEGEEGMIELYERGEFTTSGQNLMLLKLTLQDKKRVIRFTLPSWGTDDAQIFEDGPYYEAPHKFYSMLLSSLSKVPYSEDYWKGAERVLTQNRALTVDSYDESPDRYDYSDWYLDVLKIIRNPHYYDGQRIELIPSRPYKCNPYEYVEGFYWKEPRHYPLLSDTLRIYDKKGNVQIDVFTPATDVYRATVVLNQYVRSFGHSEMGDGRMVLKSGFATPLKSVEGKIFTIKTISAVKINDYLADICMHLVDPSGEDVDFVFHYRFNKNYGKDLDGYMPFLMVGKREIIENKYKGKTFVLKDQSKGRIFKKAPYDLAWNPERKIVKGKLHFFDIRFLETSEHHDYISLPDGDHASYYYHEPFLFLSDEDGDLFSFKLTDADVFKESHSSSPFTLGDLIEKND